MRSQVISYLKVGYLLHIITLIELFFSFVLFYILEASSWLANDPTLMKLVLSPLVVLPLMAQLDVRSRYQNYKLIKDHLYTYGFKTRILKPFLKSSCHVTLQKWPPTNWVCCWNVCNISTAMVIAGTT